MMSSEMERWRSFFAQAEVDLWTIIHQAILLAAVDFPVEFKHKRCEIAEVLFARRPCQSPLARSMEATRLSGSIITNATADAENGPKHVHTSRVDIKLADTHSQGTVSKASDIERHIVRGERNIELGTGLENCSASRDHPKADGLAMNDAILQDVSMIKDRIMDSTNQSEDGLLRSLHALEHLDIDVEILKATDIGREVNKFRKHLSAPVRNLVKQLVRTWKGMVDEWVRNAEAVLPLNALGEQEVFDREVSHTNSQTDVSTQTSLQPPLKDASVQQYLNKSIIDNASAVRSRLHCDQALEEMGSSRVESDELYRPGFMERKADSCQQQVQFGRSIATKTITEGFGGTGKPVTSIPDSEGAFLDETIASEHGKRSEEKLREYDQRGGSQKIGYGKAQNVSLVDHERIETMKRRFFLEDQHVERAKKQRDAPISSCALEQSKRGVVRLPACVKSQHCVQKR